MNLAQYLMTPVTPLADRVPLRETPAPRIIGGNRVSTKVAKERYKEAMGDCWMSTLEITNRVNQIVKRNGGRGVMSAYATLSKWRDQGIVESRLRTYRNRQRPEWRWIK